MHSWFILIGLALMLLAGFGGSVFGAAWGPLQQVISLAVGALLLVIGFIFL